jgi:hypothetical protein
MIIISLWFLVLTASLLRRKGDPRRELLAFLLTPSVEGDDHGGWQLLSIPKTAVLYTTSFNPHSSLKQTLTLATPILKTWHFSQNRKH